jgi:putative DNA primase/helicase
VSAEAVWPEVVAPGTPAAVDAARRRQEREGEQVESASWCDVHTLARAECGCRWEGDPVNAHRGQARMAYRLAEADADRLLYVHGIGWHYWDGRRWLEDDRGEATRAVLDVLRAALTDSLRDMDLRADVRKCETAAGVAGVLDLAAALEPFAATVADLDADPYLLNVANGTLDLHTLTLRTHDPADRITKVTGAAYRADAQGPTWTAFLARVLPDEDVRGFLARYVGLGLAGRVLEHVLAILTGTGRNGKGVFYGAVGYALGDYAKTAEPDLFMAREGAHPTGEMDLLGVRWVVVSESDQGRRLAEATVKRLSGGDRIRARRMRQDFVEFRPSHTPALVTNHLPRVSGDDPALWARLRVVPFGVTIPADEQDPHLADKLELEADAILSWAVQGWAEYQARGLAEPDAVLRATERYQADSDALGRFLAECCILNPHMWVTVADLFDRWTRWAAEDGTEPMGKRAFGDALDRRGHTVTRGTGGTRIRRGLGLAAEDPESGGESW